jgi:hypothetical protein
MARGVVDRPLSLAACSFRTINRTANSFYQSRGNDRDFNILELDKLDLGPSGLDTSAPELALAEARIQKGRHEIRVIALFKS